MRDIATAEYSNPMGRVKPLQQKETRVQNSIAQAVQAYQSGRHSTIREAADSQDIAYSTVSGRLLGRQSRRKAHVLDQTLGDVEERVVVKRLEMMDRRSFPLRVDMVRHMATRILHQ